MVSLLTDFYALSLLNFPLPHFQRPPPRDDVRYINTQKKQSCLADNVGPPCLEPWTQYYFWQQLHSK